MVVATTSMLARTNTGRNQWMERERELQPPQTEARWCHGQRPLHIVLTAQSAKFWLEAFEWENKRIGIGRCTRLSIFSIHNSCSWLVHSLVDTWRQSVCVCVRCQLDLISSLRSPQHQTLIWSQHVQQAASNSSPVCVCVWVCKTTNHQREKKTNDNNQTRAHNATVERPETVRCWQCWHHFLLFVSDHYRCWWVVLRWCQAINDAQISLCVYLSHWRNWL